MTKVKICGLRTITDVHKANRCMPDYVGFIFAQKSRRYVSPEIAQAMKRALAPGIQAVGVFVNEDTSVIAQLVNRQVIDCVQLHGDEDAAYVRALKGQVHCPIIQAVPMGAGTARALPQSPDYLLFDTATQTRGGCGKVFDWALIPRNNSTPFFLAGGLDEHNVCDAIARVSPYGVDVSSGVETDGVKDEGKMNRLIRLVREVD